MTAQELEQTLRTLPLSDVHVDVEGRPGHLVAVVTSPDFDTQDEGLRQQTVWEHLITRVPDDERVEVEFVFTLTPQEQRDLERGAPKPV
jgi:acid stress-induced BolA-like protein IbaG/YrbA